MSSIRLDVEQQCLRIDDRKYFYERKEYFDSDYDDEFGDYRWYKEDKQNAVSADSEDTDDKPIPIAQAEDIDPTGTEYTYARKRIQDPEKIRRLEHKFKKAERQQKMKEKEKLRAEEKQREAERHEDEEKDERTNRKSDKNGAANSPKVAVRKLDGTSNHEGEYKEFDWEVAGSGKRYLHKRKRGLEHGWYRETEGELKRVSSEEKKEFLANCVKNPIERTKWGTRIYSNDGKHYFGVGVWTSRGYRDCTTVRLSVAGRHFMYTLDERNMRALRAEISRGMPT
jgi:chemotaxis protein histidine kinase CheA